MILYECIYQHDQSPSSDLVTPLAIDNTEPEKRELQAYVHIYKNGLYLGHDHVGVTSPKFQLKTKIGFIDFMDFCKKNRHSDVVFINPFPQIKYWSVNAWMQGEFMHPGLIKIAQDLLKAAEIDMVINDTDRHSHRHLCFCNFWVGNQRFWKEFVGGVLVKLNDFIDNNPNHNSVLNAQLGTAHTSQACFIPFIVERLFSSWIYQRKENLSAVNYEFSESDIINTYCFNEFERSLVRRMSPIIHELDDSIHATSIYSHEQITKACSEYAIYTKDYYSKNLHPHA